MAEFDLWYRDYPRHEARKNAEKAWNGLTEEQQQRAIDMLPYHLRLWRIRGTERMYLPLPASWLRGHRFEDEIELERRVEPRETQSERRASNISELTGRTRRGSTYAGDARIDSDPVPAVPGDVRKSGD